MPNIAPLFRCTLPRLCLSSILAPFLAQPPLPAQQAGGMPASSSTIHLVRALVGAKGEARNGQFVMTEPRSTFYAPDDHEVIIYFEWEGSTGIHHCEGSVHGPNGEFATMSSFDYTATTRRFAGFWKVPLSQGTPPGGWTFESRVDGHPAGEVSFQVAVSTKPAGLPVLPAPPALPTPNDIYTRAVAATVDVEKLDAQGHSLHHSSGFVLKDGTVVTSFRGIDGATMLRLHFANGDVAPAPLIAAWDRHQDWVLLSSSTKTTPLKLAEAKSWKIGDQCYWLDVRSDGSRVLSDGTIVGFKSPANWGDRIDFSGSYEAAGLGGALLNDRGEVIGVLGGALPESFVVTHALQLGADANLLVYTEGGIAVASNLVPTSLPSSRISLQDLWNKGAMTPPLVKSDYILFGMLTKGGKPGDKKMNPGERDYKTDFQRGDSTAAALIHFSNTTSFKTTATLKLYDLDNHLVATSKTEKINANRGEYTERAWQLPLGNLPAGIYRVDIEFPEGVAWRQYFKLTD